MLPILPMDPRQCILSLGLTLLAAGLPSCAGVGFPKIPSQLLLRDRFGADPAEGDRALPRRDESFSFFKGLHRDRFRPVYFQAGSFAVAPRSHDTIAEAAGLAIERDYSLIIAGFTRPGVSPDYDRTLAERLALEVRSALIRNGLPAGRVQTAGYGSDEPSLSPEVADAERWVVIGIAGA